MPRMRLGIFGGSFDPFHAGHFLVAQAPWRKLVWIGSFCSAAQSPFKHDDQASSAEHRSVAALALQGCSDYFVDDRSCSGGFHAIETVLSYRDRYPDAQLFYLIGADHVPTPNNGAGHRNWPNWSNSHRSTTWRSALLDLRTLLGNLKGFPLEVSSSTLRLRLRERLSIRGLVHPKVEEDIVKRGIYL